MDSRLRGNDVGAAWVIHVHKALRRNDESLSPQHRATVNVTHDTTSCCFHTLTILESLIMRSSLLSLFAAVLFMCIFTLGCERQEPGNNSNLNSQSSDSINNKPVLSFASGSDHHYLDPQKMSWLHDIRMADLLFTPLVRWQIPSLKLEPAAAASWDISEDHKTYTFHLREDGKWSNSDPVTAHDFAYAWRRALLPEMAADYSQLFFCIKGARAFYDRRLTQMKTKVDSWQDMQADFEKTVGIEVVDDLTLKVTLEQPTPYFLQLCAFATFFPVHSASLSRLENASVQEGLLTPSAILTSYWSDPKQLISNGPYTLSRRRFKRDVLVLPNRHYFDLDKLANGGWLEVINDNPQTQLIEFRQGKFDWLPDIPTTSSIAADLVAQKLSTVHTLPSAGTYFYNFNCLPTLPDGRKNPLADVRVRRALSMGIDRQKIVDRVSRMGQPIAKTFVPPGVIEGYEPPVDQGTSYNLGEARKLLADAGYPGGKGLTGLSILYNTGHGHENPAQQIKRAWEENLGVVVELEALESKRFSELLKSKKYTIARASWFGDYRDPSTFLEKFVTDGGNNDSAWSNAEYDNMLTAAATEIDSAKRMATYQKAETLMLHEAPIAPIFQYLDVYIYDDNKVKGLTPNPWKFRRLDLVSKVGE